MQNATFNQYIDEDVLLKKFLISNGELIYNFGWYIYKYTTGQKFLDGKIF